MTYLQRYLYKVPTEDQNSGALAFYAAIDHVANVAPSVSCAIIQELRDQCSYLKMIASENYSSLATQLAMGNLLTDKYAEGSPYHRFYAGCDNVDAIEADAVNELKVLFGCDHAYVQPHSGADANLIAFWAILCHKIQDPALNGRKLDELSEKEYDQIRQKMNSQKIMGMSLGSGGHLTHGYRHNVSSKMMRACHYEVDPQTGLLDYDKIAEQAEKEKPLILLAGYSAYPRKINFARMREIADSVGAVLMVDMAHFAGLVAGKAFTGEYDPIPYADIVTSTTHKTLRGPRGGIVLCKSEFKQAVDKGCPMVLGGPLPHAIAAKVVAFKEANLPAFREYAAQVVANAQALAEALSELGAEVLTGGTDNHMVLVDVRPYGINGRQAEKALREGHITLNRNAIPRDPNGPWYTSGIRLGTPALTTLGMGIEEMRVIAKVIVGILSATKPVDGSKAKVEVDQNVVEEAKKQVNELLRAFPLYPELEIEGAQLATT